MAQLCRVKNTLRRAPRALAPTKRGASRTAACDKRESRLKTVFSIENKKTSPLCRGEDEYTSRYHPDYGFRRISSALIAGIRPGRPGLAREWLPVLDTGPFSIRSLSGVSCADSFRLSQSQFQLTNGIVPEIRDLSRTDPNFQRYSCTFDGSAIFLVNSALRSSARLTMSINV